MAFLKIYFLEQFSFTGKLRGRDRYPIFPLPTPQSPPLSTSSHRMVHFIRLMNLHLHIITWCIVGVWCHPWCVYSEFGHLYNAICPLSQIIENNFTAQTPSLLYVFISSPHPCQPVIFYSVCSFLPFPEGQSWINTVWSFFTLSSFTY